MSNKNTLYKKEKLEDLTKKHFIKVARIVMESAYTSHYVAAKATDTFILYHDQSDPECQGPRISLRKRNEDVELIITNKTGASLFYGNFDCRILGINLVAGEYYKIFKKLEMFIPLETPLHPETFQQ